MISIIEIKHTLQGYQMKNRFYLACFRDNVGGNIAFHGIDGNGYVTDISKAHQYTLEEAQQEWEGAREYDQPISADHIDALTCDKVDCQKLPSESDLSKTSSGYVAFKKGAWNGNDVYWHSLEGSTLNFKLAMTLTLSEAKALGDRYVVVPFELANSAKRKTFAMSLLNRKTMIQGAGLKTPDRIKRNRRRKNNPMERWNCPECGIINWQLNPHDFQGCSRIECKESKY